MSNETEPETKTAPTEPPASKPKKTAKPKAPKSAKKAAKPKAPKTAKPKTPKSAKKAAKPKEADRVPTGQGAKKIGIDEEKLNTKEKAVLSAVRRAGEIELTELAARSFPNKSKKQGNSWTRNALRRLVREKFVKKSDRGTYKKGG